MADDWCFYPTEIGDKPAFVYGNFGIGGEVPREGSAWLLQVFVRMRSPRDNGLSSQGEADALWMAEDALVAALREQLDAEFVGRVTTDGRRDFFFYGPVPHGLELHANLALAPHGYTASAEGRSDPDWSFFREVLYPSVREWQTIRNGRVLDALSDQGDDLSQARRVHHWIYFRDTESRARFARAAKERGFGVAELEGSAARAERRYGVQVHRIDSVRFADINSTCLDLFDLAAEHDADYDGWETQVVKPGAQPTDDAPPDQSA